MREYAARRLFLLVPVMLGVSLVTFTLSHFVGDPVAPYVRERTPEAQIQMIIKEKGLDQPVYVQYLVYMNDLLHGDWGYSRSDHNRRVIESIRDYLPATFELTLVAVMGSLLLGIPLGIVSAVRKDRPVDHASRLFSVAGISMPIFWLGLIMQYVFYYQLQVHSLPYLPQAQRVAWQIAYSNPLKEITGLYLVDSLFTLNIPFFISSLWHIIMPGFALSFHYLALIARITRSSMLEVMRQDYITLARSKGLSERVVILRHALKNSLIPTVTVTGLAFGGLLGGAVITETVFAWPGMGRWATRAIISSDIGAIMGFTLLMALIYVLVNLAVDLIYGLVDPRIRYG